MPDDSAIVWGRHSHSGSEGNVSEPIIIWNTRDPLGGKSKAAFEEALKKALEGRVDAAYIFGSYGTKAFNRDSDVDLFLVLRTEKSFLERGIDFYDVLDLAPSIDLLVYTPEEFERLTNDPSPGFWESAVATLRRIV